MRKRIGIVLMLTLTLLLLKLVSVAFGVINLPSDMAVFLGCMLLGSVVIVGPWLYKTIELKLIKPIKTI